MSTKKIVVFALFVVKSLLTLMFGLVSFASSQPGHTATSAAITSKTGTYISCIYTIKNICSDQKMCYAKV